MVRLIGVTDMTVASTSRLKRAALLCDTIELLEPVLPTMPGPDAPSFDEIDWLQQQGLVEYTSHAKIFSHLSSDLKSLIEKVEQSDGKQRRQAGLDILQRFFSRFNAVLDSFRRIAESYDSTSLRPLRRWSHAAEFGLQLASARAAALRIMNDVDAVLIAPSLRRALQLPTPDQDEAFAAAVNIALPFLPQPTDDTPWEAIVAFRNDPTAREQYARLRHWLRGAASSEQSQKALSDEIEYLVVEYESAMRRHRLRYHRGLLEIVVVAAADALENLMRFKFGATARTFFQISQHHIALLDAEAASPGREVAYISHAREVFAQRPSA